MSQSLDLESLMDLIDEDDPDSEFQSTSCENARKSSAKGFDLESFLDLMEDAENETEPTPGNSRESSGDLYNSSFGKTKDATADSSSNVTAACKRSKILNDVDLLSQPGSTVSQGPSLANGSSLVHTGDTSDEEEDKECLTETGTLVKEKIKLKSYYEKADRRDPGTWKSQKTAILDEGTTAKNTHSLDALTGIRIVNPLVAYDVMQKRLEGRRLVKMSFMKNYVKKGDIEGDWVTIGVLVRKVPPKTAKNGKLFSIWKLSDLHDTEKIVSLFLFGQVHNDHWKTAAGTVIGLLNPIILEGKENDEYMSLKVDHPGKVMLVGTSKDFGSCKGVRKDGSKCNMVVNLSMCQYCVYHVKKEYKKFSGRMDLQSSWSGRPLGLKDRVLKGHNFFYAGQSFSPLGKPERKSNSVSSKDKLTLSSLTLKRKAETVIREDGNSVKRIAEMYGEDVSKAAQKNSQFINNRLTIPSVGSRNIVQHMMKNKAVVQGSFQSPVSAKKVLEQNAFCLEARKTLSCPKRKDDASILRNLIPVVGKGLSPGQNVTLDISTPNSKGAVGQLAKLKAIQKIRQNGPIKKQDPNATKCAPELNKIKSVLSKSFEEEQKSAGDAAPKESVSRSKLGSIDLNSEKVQKYLNQKSSHAYEVEMAEMEKEAAYFLRLEKKEMMEEKMASTKEVVCDVVSCRQCRYTAQQAADRCKDEKHPLKCHKAIKRFFACKDCKHRTECFTRFPHRACSFCGSSRFERTGMMKVRQGPKLDSEILNICGDEAKYLNSL